MAKSDKLRVLTYDVSSNVKRRKIARMLENEASRVQYSVFEGRLTDASVRRLISKIEAHLEESDSFRVYTIGAVGERHCKIAGDGPPIEPESGYWLF